MNLTIGKSALLRIPKTIRRVSLGNPAVADVAVISPHELYLIGKAAGSTNVMLWDTARAITVFDVHVNVDASRLEARMRELIPEEDKIAVNTAAETVVLTGTVSSSEAAWHAERIAEAHAYDPGPVAKATANAPSLHGAASARLGQGVELGAAAAAGRARVVNMLTVIPPHVLLEVSVTEVSKSLTSRLGSKLGVSHDKDDWRYTVLESALGHDAELFAALKGRNDDMAADGAKPDGLMRLLANPSVLAMSGQEGSFVAGGTIFLPVRRMSAATDLSTVAFEAKEFGVGLKFTPTVLRSGRIALSVSPESSELLRDGSFMALEGRAGAGPIFATRRAQAAIELDEGQSLLIAGWFECSPVDAIKRVPALGEVPILGALLRSEQFQAGESELVLVITPHIIRRPSPEHISRDDEAALPGQSELAKGGATQNDSPRKDPRDRLRHAAASAKGGFEVK